MNDKLYLQISTPDLMLFNDYCTQVTLPGSEGIFSILSGHMNYVALLQCGIIEVTNAKNMAEFFFIQEGICKIFNNKCTIISDVILAKSNANVEEIKLGLARLEADLMQAQDQKKNEILNNIKFYKLIINS